MPEAKGGVEHDKLQFVDTLRAVAIIGVLLVHISQHVDGINEWMQKGLLVIYLIVNGTGPRFWLGDQEEITVANIAAHVLILNGLNPYWINSIIGVEWSIAVECMFYLFVPLLFKLIRSARHAAWFVMIVLVLSYGLNTWFAQHPWIRDHAYGGIICIYGCRINCLSLGWGYCCFLSGKTSGIGKA